MEVDWSAYRLLECFKRHSATSQKEFHVIVDKILSFLHDPGAVSEPSDPGPLKDYADRQASEGNISSLDTTAGALTETSSERSTDDSLSSASPFPGPEKRRASDISGADPDEAADEPRLKTPKHSETPPAPAPTAETTEFFGSDLIFDMRYCSLQLPIPPEVYQDRDDPHTLETDAPASTANYDVCYDEEEQSNHLMAEPFRFLSKVHVTFDSESGEQWCCCYFDALGNYVKKRFNTSRIAFNTAKVLANKCREAAEQSFHNIWILKHRNLLDRPIPEKLAESFIGIVNKIGGHIADEHCLACCAEKIRETLSSTHTELLK